MYGPWEMTLLVSYKEEGRFRSGISENVEIFGNIVNFGMRFEYIVLEMIEGVADLPCRIKSK